MDASEHLTVPDIIRKAGGARAIVDAVNTLDGKPRISAWAVYKWPAIGIPDQHWPTIIEIAGVSAEQLYQANVLARAVPAQAASEAA